MNNLFDALIYKICISQYVLYGICWRFQTFDKCNATQLTRIEAMNEYVMRHDGGFFFLGV